MNPIKISIPVSTATTAAAASIGTVVVIAAFGVLGTALVLTGAAVGGYALHRKAKSRMKPADEEIPDLTQDG